MWMPRPAWRWWCCGGDVAADGGGAALRSGVAAVLRRRCVGGGVRTAAVWTGCADAGSAVLSHDAVAVGRRCSGMRRRYGGGAVAAHDSAAGPRGVDGALGRGQQRDADEVGVDAGGGSFAAVPRGCGGGAGASHNS